MLEVLRCKGYSVLPEEENLRIKLESLQRELDRPTQFKGRISELKSVIQTMKESELLQTQDQYVITDDSAIQTIQKVLSEQQQALAKLMSILNQDNDLSLSFSETFSFITFSSLFAVSLKLFFTPIWISFPLTSNPSMSVIGTLFSFFFYIQAVC